jgi:cobalt-zinc-cadmium resistance protein CzcA
MMEKLIRFSVEQRWLVLLFTLLAVLGGIWSFRHLPIDAVPDVTNVQVQINTPIEGLAPEEVEKTVTYPIETAMGGIPRVEQVRSLTRFDLSQVTVIFAEGTDIYLARQWVNERLQEAAEGLPPNAKPKLGPVTKGLGEIVHYSVEAKRPAEGEARIAELMRLRDIQEFYVRPRLLTVPGLADVGTIGGYERQFLVQPRPDEMAAYGIHFDDIAEALEKVNRNVGSGYLQQTAEQFVVQGLGRLKNSEAIRQVPVKTLENFRTLRIGDIAEVREGPGLRMGAALVNGKEAVLGTAMMLIGENSRQVSQAVTGRIQEIRGELPVDVDLELLYDRSDLVDATLSTVEHNLLYGALLVVIVLLLLLGNIRAALITALTIPLCLALTFLFMKPLGISGNLMSLGALDFGILVDGVVIVLDNCVRRIELRSRSLGRPLSPVEKRETLIEAAVQVRTAAGFGELIILAVFLPIFAFTGIEGKMFIPMAATFMIALASALVLSFTTAPALASILLSGKSSDREPWLMAAIRVIYLRVLGATLRIPRLALTLAFGLVLFSFFLFSRLGAEFIPRLNEGSLVLQFLRPTNISLSEAVNMQSLSERIIGEFPEVSHVFSRVGTSDVATDPMPVSLVDTYVMFKSLKDKSEGLTRAIAERLESEIPGQRILLTQPIEMRFNELLEGLRSDVALKIFGEDLELLAGFAKQAQELIQKVPGIAEVETDVQGLSPLLRIEPREEVLAKLGVSTQEILDTIAIAIGGREVGAIYEGVRHYPLVIRLEEGLRANLEALKKIPVGIFPNQTLPLDRLAELRFEDEVGTLFREQGKRRVAVLINAADRDIAGLVKRAQADLKDRIQLPQQYFMEWGGNFKNLLEARRRLLYLVPGVLLLVFLMIHFAFRNWLQTLLIFLCIPFAWVGAVFSMRLMEIPFSLSAAVGFIALSGIAVLNGLVLTNFYNDLHQEGLRGAEWVRRGASVRLRPVLMTALVEIFGFLPMMLSTGVGAEVQRPLATVVIGGILSSMILTLLLLPCLNELLEDRIYRLRKA